MSLFEDTNPRKLMDLLSEIHNRVTALPDFQRDFVCVTGATLAADLEINGEDLE